MILDEARQGHPYITLKMQSADMGLIFEILSPKEISREQPIIVYVTFPGVRSKETFVVAWERAPGDDCFRANERILFLDNLNQIIDDIKQKTNRKIHIALIGHSLGGAYAQLGFHALQRVIVHNQVGNHCQNPALNVDNIASLTLGVWNAAGVVAEVANNSLVLAESLAKMGVKQRALYGLVEGDTLQTLGQGIVLCGVSPAMPAVI